jgi:hypothetical protein
MKSTCKLSYNTPSGKRVEHVYTSATADENAYSLISTALLANGNTITRKAYTNALRQELESGKITSPHKVYVRVNGRSTEITIEWSFPQDLSRIS